MVPPFVEPQIVSPEDDEYEDVVYSLSGAFFKTADNNVYERIKMEYTLSEATSPVARTFQSEAIDENTIKSRDDLARWVTDTLEHETLEIWDPTKCEVWIVHDDQIPCPAVSLTAGMLVDSNARHYKGTDYRGHLQVTPNGHRISIPVYTWLDYGTEGFGVFLDNTVLRQFRPKIPEGHVPSYHNIIQDIPDEEYETRAWNAFEEMFENAGFLVRDSKYEPNGPTSFPDWQASIDGHLCDIEVTRMLKGMLGPRLVTAQRKPLSGGNDPRIENAISNARFSENEIRQSISATLIDKTRKRTKFGSSNPCILIIANDFFSPMEARFRVWDDHDYSVFDGVFLANYDVASKKFDFQNILADRRKMNESAEVI